MYSDEASFSLEHVIDDKEKLLQIVMRRIRAQGQLGGVIKMIEEARILTETYSDGVGIYAFKENPTGTGYEPTELSRGVSQRVTSLDNVLATIAAQMQQIMSANRDQVPPPVQPPAHPVNRMP